MKTTFADRINPHKFNFSPKLVAIVGAIIGHDYGARDGVRGGQLLAPISITSDGFVTARSTASDGGGAFIGDASDLTRNLDAYERGLADAGVSAADIAEFQKLRASNVQDWRSSVPKQPYAIGDISHYDA